MSKIPQEESHLFLRVCSRVSTALIADGAPCHMLDTQYRMHPAIAQLPADLIYAGRLASGVRAGP